MNLQVHIPPETLRVLGGFGQVLRMLPGLSWSSLFFNQPRPKKVLKLFRIDLMYKATKWQDLPLALQKFQESGRIRAGFRGVRFRGSFKTIALTLLSRIESLPLGVRKAALLHSTHAPRAFIIPWPSAINTLQSPSEPYTLLPIGTKDNLNSGCRTYNS